MSKWLIMAVIAGLVWAYSTGRLAGLLPGGQSSPSASKERPIFGSVLLCSSKRDLQTVLHKTQQGGEEGRKYAMKKASCWMSKAGDRAAIIDDASDPIEIRLSDGRRAFAQRGSL